MIHLMLFWCWHRRR